MSSVKKRLGSNGQVVFVVLTVELPCCRLISADKICHTPTSFALMYPSNDHDLIFPCCIDHLPQWTLPYLKQFVQEVHG